MEAPSEASNECAAVLKRVIMESHQLLLFENAIFMAERLFALENSLESLYWVAQSRFLNGDFSHVYHMLGAFSPFASFFEQTRDFPVWQWKALHLWGVCCIKLNKLQQADKIFSQQHQFQQSMQQQSTPVPPASCAATHFFLGRVCRRTNRSKAAGVHFSEAFTVNPFLFTAFEDACAVGQADKVDASQIFSASNSEQFADRHFTCQRARMAERPGNEQGAESDDSCDELKSSGGSTGFMSPVAANSTSFTAMGEQVPPTNSTPTAKRPGKQAKPGSSVRRPRPVVSPPPAVSSPLSSPSTAAWLAAKRAKVWPCNRAACLNTYSAHEELVITPGGIRGLLQLLMQCAQAYRLSCLYQSHDVMQALQRLPSKQQATGWWLHLLAKAHFELASYANACQIFAQLRQLEPYRTEGMVEYSSALYQLKREKELSELAQSMVEKNRESPATLCVLANCFSLAGDHEAAIRFLKRAGRVDHYMCYSYTLLGHEQFHLDNLDEALQAYRWAIQVNPLHYNAWYGLGQVYVKQERYESANYYFSVALRINPKSSPLYVHLALTLQYQDKLSEALFWLREAIRIQPGNLLARLKKAEVLAGVQRYDEALEELLILKERAPKEAQIYLLMGKIYKQLKQYASALQCLTMAMDLEPKETAHIKSLMERIYEQDGQE
eukprot:TRINITY_DN8264_c0_g1_i1.p1 TRINITY_DN8264_c0_g1~~TRINITY_DN8264_c0_g1_i1.p1  ORF type:complete len:666 (-),score=78.27 TRINITY_DN8264_c0_g1_i1:14-2011(-)